MGVLRNSAPNAIIIMLFYLLYYNLKFIQKIFSSRRTLITRTTRLGLDHQMIQCVSQNFIKYIWRNYFWKYSLQTLSIVIHLCYFTVQQESTECNPPRVLISQNFLFQLLYCQLPLKMVLNGFGPTLLLSSGKSVVLAENRHNIYEKKPILFTLNLQLFLRFE